MMRILLVIVSTLLTATLFTPTLTKAESVETIATRPGVTVKAIVWGETTADAPIVILFMGGDGRIKLDSWDGSGNPVRNFLVRTRKHFVRNGLFAIVPDIPSDRQEDGLYTWRTSEAHAADIAALIKHMRNKSKGPVFLIGHSRGSISAASVAATLPKGAITGVVLASSVTRYPRGKFLHRVQDGKLQDIQVPVLFVHHKNDLCDVTVAEDIPDLAKKFTAAPNVKITIEEEGGKYRGSECGSLSAHGFRSIEARVVDQIASWVKDVAEAARK